MGAISSAILRCAHLFRQVSFHTVVLGARAVNIGVLVVRSAVLFVAGARDARAPIIHPLTDEILHGQLKSSDACMCIACAMWLM